MLYTLWTLNSGVSSSGYTNRSCGKLEGDDGLFVAARTGGAAAAIYWSSYSFYQVFSFVPHFRSPLPSTISQQIMCLFNNTKNSALYLTFPYLNSYPGSLPGDLTDAIKGVPVINWSWKICKKGSFLAYTM